MIQYCSLKLGGDFSVGKMDVTNFLSNIYFLQFFPGNPTSGSGISS